MLTEQHVDVIRAVVLLRDPHVAELLRKQSPQPVSEELEGRVATIKALIELDHVRSDPDVMVHLRDLEGKPELTLGA